MGGSSKFPEILTRCYGPWVDQILKISAA